MSNELSEFGPKGCPYLGLEEDRSVMLLDASPLHRCFADPKENYTPTLQYQADTCLCEAHTECPRYQKAAPLGDVVKPPPRKGQRSGSGWLIPALVGLIVLGIGGWFAYSYLGHRGGQATVAQTGAGQADAQSTPTAAAVAANATPSEAATGAAGAAGAAAGAAASGAQTSTQPGGAQVAAGAQTTGTNTTGAASGADGGATAGVTGTNGSAAAGAVAVAGSKQPAASPAPNTGGAEAGGTGTGTGDATAAATPTPTAGNTQISLFSRVTPTPVEGGQRLTLGPGFGGAGWWRDGDPERGNLNDSFLYAGNLNGENYIGAVKFDLARVPRGAPILQGSLELTGLRDEQLDRNADASWLVQLIGENELATLGGSNFMMLFSAPSSITLLPQLKPGDVGAGKTNKWNFDAATLQWLEQQRIAGATSVLARVIGVRAGTANTLFGWDSGLGSVSSGNAPRLTLTLGAPPTVTPPIPTRFAIVATFTPPPANVQELVALQQTATAVAATTGTFTPMPYFVTPTPQPKNVATVQAAAQLAGMPAVLIETPAPANAATATEMANYATAVAQTTGTFTPVPTAYVTPFKVLPSPPAANLLTEAARNAEATVVAATMTPPPLPYNAVLAQYVIATNTPENVATAAVVVREATAAAQLNGTATPTPWEWQVITPTPVPQATATATLPPLLLATDFTPTPSPTAGPTEAIPNSLPAEFVNKILFKTNRTGEDEYWVFDPTNNTAVGKITRNWVYPMAVKQLAVSPDGKNVAIVKADNRGVLQIFVRSLEYKTEKQITAFDRDSYDPAWSPTGEWIAFVTTNSGNDEVYRVSPDGKTVQQLTKNTFEWDKHPTWSPDGKQIVWYSNRETGRRQLWIMNNDGGGQRNLTSDEYENWDPIWTR